jgi:transposase InsO family protein
MAAPHLPAGPGSGDNGGGREPALCDHRWPAYGYRSVHAELVRQGWRINHKRILRLMRIDNLLCVRRRKFILTTDSGHGLLRLNSDRWGRADVIFDRALGH